MSVPFFSYVSELIRCTDIEINEDVEIHYFEFEHISFSGDDTEPDHVVWLPAFMLILEKGDVDTPYDFVPLTSLGELMRSFLPHELLWSVPKGWTIKRYMEFISSQPMELAH